jgi:uncharacterized Tic20 family protein
MATEPTPPSPEFVPAEIPSSSEDRTLALLCHLGGILAGFLVPLVIWLIKKDQSRFVDDQGKEALNFQLTVLIAWAVSFASAFVFIGLVLLPAVMILNIVFCILAAVAANQGQVYRYPLNIRLIK